MTPLNPIINPELLRHILDVAGLVMATMLLMVVALLVFQKSVLETRARTAAQAMAHYAHALGSGTSIQDLRFDPRNKIDRKALARLLVTGAVTVNPDDLRNAPWYSNLISQLQSDAAHGDWGERAFAFEMLGYLGDAQLRPFVQRAALGEKRSEVYAACLTCLARFAGQADGLDALWQQLELRPPLSGSFNEGLFRTAMMALNLAGNQDSTTFAIRQLLDRSAPDNPLTLNLISAIGKTGLLSLAPDLASRYAQPDAPKNFRIVCIRALGMLAPAHPTLLDALNDPDWEIEAVSARYIRDHRPVALARLSTCLASPSFYVRYNSALSLAAMGQAGKTQLEAALASNDRFSRDISRYALKASSHEPA